MKDAISWANLWLFCIALASCESCNELNRIRERLDKVVEKMARKGEAK